MQKHGGGGGGFFYFTLVSPFVRQAKITSPELLFHAMIFVREFIMKPPRPQASSEGARGQQQKYCKSRLEERSEERRGVGKLL
jgi:hypothetical protein